MVSLLHEGVIELAAAISQLPEDQRPLYSLLIESNLSAAARKAMEMHPRLEKFLSETQRQQLQQTRAEARAEGRAEGEATALLKILARRGLEPTPEQRRRITECTELAVLERWLERWLDRSLSAASVDELLA